MCVTWQVLVSHALYCAPPTPSRLILSKLQGDVVIVGATLGFSKDHSKMSDNHALTGGVPFRMTRMMTILLSSVGLQGGFSAAMGAAAMAITHPHRMLKHHLYSLLREEILSYGFLPPKPGQALEKARIDHGKLVNYRAVECAGQVSAPLFSQCLYTRQCVCVCVAAIEGVCAAARKYVRARKVSKCVLRNGRECLLCENAVTVC